MVIILQFKKDVYDYCNIYLTVILFYYCDKEIMNKNTHQDIVLVLLRDIKNL